MVGGFRRSLSFPIPGFAPLNPRHRNPVRPSILSCHFHPVVSLLDDRIRGLREWHAAPLPLCGSPKWIAAGLELLDVLLAALADLLFLPQAQEPIRRRLLDDFLRLADAHGSFRADLTELKSCQSDAQVALRRNDEPRLASAVRAQRRAEKEFIRLAAGIRDVARSPVMAEEEDSGEKEMAGIMRKVTAAAVEASGAVMVAVAAVSGESAACGTRRQAWVVAVLRWSARAKAKVKAKKKEWEEGRERERAAVLWWSARAKAKAKKKEWEEGRERERERAAVLWWSAWARAKAKAKAKAEKKEWEEGRERERERAAAWRGAALDKMEKLEECIKALEGSSERVFRALVNARVSLLNILTPIF